MPGGDDVFWIYLGAVLAVGVIVLALGVALVMYQRRFLALHREYAKKLIAAHEEERAYVAREVHDDALQRVAMIQHDVVEWLDGPVDQRKERARSTALKQELQDLGVMLRRVAHRLHPAMIDQGGLLPALSQLAEDTTRLSGVNVTARVPANVSDKILDRERSLILFRIVQEALRNVTKHAAATRAEIGVDFAKESLILTVSDNGRGFDSGDSRPASGLGLISMAERARLADGEYSLWSKPGGGTTIRVTVPLQS
ncbi:MAG: sensor histidine kinase [Gemmatimonadaceae bacterium]